MKAELKNIDLNSDIAFVKFRPEDPNSFGFYITATIGPVDFSGGDLFQILVCTDDWYGRMLSRGRLRDDRHLLVSAPYDTSAIREVIVDFINACNGDSWESLAQQLSKKTLWEFEDYKE
jgi:hypothetical protein